MFFLLLSQVKSLKEICFVTIRVCVSVSPVFLPILKMSRLFWFTYTGGSCNFNVKTRYLLIAVNLSICPPALRCEMTQVCFLFPQRPANDFLRVPSLVRRKKQRSEYKVNQVSY